MTEKTTPPNENIELDESGFLKGTKQPAVDTAPEESAAPPVQRRGRGRPTNAERAAAEQIEAGGKTTKTATKKTAAKQVKFSADTVTLMGKQLVGVHMIAAQVTGLPELIIGDAEGLALAQGIVLVAEQYNLSIDGKTGAAMQLFFTAAMIYGPRALSINAKIKQAKANPHGNLQQPAQNQAG